MLGAVVSEKEDSLANPALSLDGRQVAVQRTRSENIDIWLIDVERGVESRASYAESSEASPVWSPDGRSVIFRSRRDGRQDLFQKDVTGSAEQILASTAQDESPADWSADGSTVLFTTQDPKGASDIWALPMHGSRTPFPVVQSPFDEIQPAFSPDGRWLAYASNESGRYEVYVHALRGDLKWQLSTGGGWDLRLCCFTPGWQRAATSTVAATLHAHNMRSRRTGVFL
jgi:Tol biopolymer transport system component